MKYTIKENKNIKMLRSPEFNYNFNKITGYHEQWGKTKDENPQRCNLGPIIADIEVLDKCLGPGSRDDKVGDLCGFCYKQNNPKGTHTDLETYKKIFHKLPKTLTQIAFGADANLTLNPDLFDIMQYTRDNGIVPNITCADIDENIADKLSKVAGAVAVSWYGVHSDKNYCYDSIKLLTVRIVPGRTLQTVNMHFMLSKETFPYIDELINDCKNDQRLSKLTAVVFLSLKTKGRGKKYERCSDKEFQIVVDKMMQAGIGIGFDSCSAPKAMKAYKNLLKINEEFENKTMSENPWTVAKSSNQKSRREYYKNIDTMATSCESFSESIYVNDKGVVFPCSFMEDEHWNKMDYNNSKGWNLLDDSIKDSNEFTTKIWNSNRGKNFSLEASMCASCGNGCQYFDV